MTHLVMPIAGRSSRFAQYSSVPKWSLNLGGKTALERALDSVLAEKLLGISEVVFVAHERHSDLLSSLKYEHGPLSALGQILTVSETPNGQAFSVAKALEAVPQGKSFIVWNGDSAISEGWSEGLSISDNWLLVSRLEGNHWSFVEAKNCQVSRTTEKLRISPLASLGLYRFANKELYLRALARQANGPGEVYVAPLYNEIIGEMEAVTCSEISSNLFQAFGTPQELVETCKRNRWSLPEDLSGIDDQR